MKSKIIVGIIVVILLLIGTYLYFEWQGEEELKEYANTVQMQENANQATTTEGTATMKNYTMSEVALHNKKSDCWMVINGKVEDVTSFIDKHPGGDRILEGCGIDATKLFNTVPGHLRGIAQLLLTKLEIGTLTK